MKQPIKTTAENQAEIDKIAEETKDLPAISPEELAAIRAQAFEDAKAAIIAENEAKVEAAKASGERRFPVTILRDYWAKDDVADQWPRNSEGTIIDNRIIAGTRISLPISEARKLISAGIAERADALPEI